MYLLDDLLDVYVCRLDVFYQMYVDDLLDVLYVYSTRCTQYKKKVIQTSRIFIKMNRRSLKNHFANKQIKPLFQLHVHYEDTSQKDFFEITLFAFWVGIKGAYKQFIDQ